MSGLAGFICAAALTASAALGTRAESNAPEVETRKPIFWSDTSRPFALGPSGNRSEFRLIRKHARISEAVNFGNTLVRVSIVDERGRRHFSETHDLPLQVPEGFETMGTAYAVLLKSGRGNGLLLGYEGCPSAPSGFNMRIFSADSASRLVAVTAWLEVPGYPLTEPKNQEIPLDKDSLLHFLVTNGSVPLTVSFALNFDPRKKNQKGLRFSPPGYNRAHSLAILPLHGKVRADDLDTNEFVTLYQDLARKKKIRMRVPPAHKIRLLDAYMPLPRKHFSDPRRVFEQCVKPEELRIRVRLGGKEGWCEGEDLHRLRLPAVGSIRLRFPPCNGYEQAASFRNLSGKR